MKKWIVEIETSDKFRKGNCKSCPMLHIPEDDDPHCAFGSYISKCPLKKSHEEERIKIIKIATKMIKNYIKEKAVNPCKFCVNTGICQKCCIYTKNKGDALRFALYK